ncbi:MAG: sigma-54-dependent Fis family transcriptional regulator, partial [Alphaproteobacteria bacterium]|nr:sigma-54-dependent Fis family transcriptional regulator [Alphaproteobacteria bacterium]
MHFWPWSWKIKKISVRIIILSKKRDGFLTTILIVDDEKEICRALKGILSDEGYRVLMAHTPEEASVALITENPNLLLLDVWFGKGSWDGVYFLDRIQLSHPSIPVIMISGHATLSLAVSALQKGAHDFLEKPINVNRLLLSVKRALEFRQIRSHLVSHQHTNAFLWPLPLDARLKKLAMLDTRILLIGEKGTGKTRLAKHLHYLSPKHEAPLLVASSTMLNAMDDHTFFGSQSGGKIEKLGFFEHAQGGTVILRNVHRLSIERQRTLSELFESGTITRLGGERPVPLNVRFIATALPHILGCSVQPLPQPDSGAPLPEHTLWPQNMDRSFYDRMTLTYFQLDPLRHHIPSISVWAKALLEELSQEHDVPTPQLSDETLLYLKTFSWPGNVAQLHCVLKRILMDGSHTTIDVHHLPQELIAQDTRHLIRALSLP